MSIRFKTLRLINAFQHSDLSIDFGNFNAVIGPNGTGKSNIIHALRAVLGMKMELPGTVDSMIKDGETAGSVELTVEHEGELVKLTTKLGASNRTLTRGKLKLRAAAEVLDYIENTLLGTSYDVVAQSNIVHQGEFTAGLLSTPAERKKSFMRLAGLQDIEMKRNALSAESDQVSVPLIAIGSSVLQDKIARLEQQIVDLDAAKSQLKVNHVKLDQCRALVRQGDDVTAAKEKLVNVKASMEAIKGTIVDATAELNKLKGEKEMLVSSLPTDDELVNKKASLLSEQTKKREWDAKKKAEADLKTCLSLIASLNAPADYAGPDVDKLRELISETKALISSIETARDALGRYDGNGKCPTCDGALDKAKSAQLFEEKTKTLVELESALSEMGITLKASTEQMSAVAIAKEQYTKEFNRHVARRDALNEALSKMGDVVEPQDTSGLLTVIESAKKAKEGIAALDKQLAEYQRIIEDAEYTLKSKNMELHIYQERAALTLDAAVITVSKQFIKEQEDTLSMVSKKDGQIVELRKQLDTTKTELSDALEKEKEHAKLTEYTGFLGVAKSVLHRDNFPSGKIKAFIDRMLVGTNIYLEVLQAGFTIFYDQDEGFKARFISENKVQPATRLSGAEKIMFAIAFRLGVNEMRSTAGFLVLDEPTVFMDDYHVGRVVESLRLLKKNVASRLQIIVVTHDMQVASVADKVTDLGALKGV